VSSIDQELNFITVNLSHYFLWGWNKCL